MFFFRGKDLNPIVVVDPKKMTIHDQFHAYTQDIRDLKQIEGRQSQRLTLANNSHDKSMIDKEAAELSRIQKMIEIAEKTILKLVEREEKRDAPR